MKWCGKWKRKAKGRRGGMMIRGEEDRKGKERKEEGGRMDELRKGKS